LHGNYEQEYHKDTDHRKYHGGPGLKFRTIPAGFVILLILTNGKTGGIYEGL
jgi:hypothetical protein